MFIWFIFTAERFSFQSVNVTLHDFLSFTAVFQLHSHSSRRIRYSCSFPEANMESTYTPIMALSSTNVPNVSPSETGKSKVFNTYNMGPRTVPCGTQEYMGIFLIPYHQPLLQIPIYACMPSLVWSNQDEVFFWFWLGNLYANTLVTYRNAAVQCCQFSKALLITSIMWWHCCTVKWVCRKWS
jgi:hypothetical protein